MLRRLIPGSAVVVGIAAVVIGLSATAEAKTPRYPPPGGCISTMECVWRGCGNVFRMCADALGNCPPVVCIPNPGTYCVCAAPHDVCCDYGTTANAPGCLMTLQYAFADPNCPSGIACFYANANTPCASTYPVCY